MRYKQNSIPAEVVSKMSVADKRVLGIHFPDDEVKPGATEDERALHNEILEHCKFHGLLAFHGSMAHRTFRTAGEPDFVILLPDGKMMMVECKTKNGKLSPEQLGVAMWAEKLGHRVYTVRSYVEFLTFLATI